MESMQIIIMFIQEEQVTCFVNLRKLRGCWFDETFYILCTWGCYIYTCTTVSEFSSNSA